MVHLQSFSQTTCFWSRNSTHVMNVSYIFIHLLQFTLAHLKLCPFFCSPPKSGREIPRPFFFRWGRRRKVQKLAWRKLGNAAEKWPSWYMRCFPKIGGKFYPQNGMVKVMENLIKIWMIWFGGKNPYFLETPIYVILKQIWKVWWMTMTGLWSILSETSYKHDGPACASKSRSLLWELKVGQFHPISAFGWVTVLKWLAQWQAFPKDSTSSCI